MQVSEVQATKKWLKPGVVCEEFPVCSEQLQKEARDQKPHSSEEMLLNSDANGQFSAKVADTLEDANKLMKSVSSFILKYKISYSEKKK